MILASKLWYISYNTWCRSNDLKDWPTFLMNSTSATIDRQVTAERGSLQGLATAFFALFCLVGFSLWGLPFFYDFMVRQFGWTRAQVTSGNAISKLIVGPAFGFLAGWMVD